MARIRRRFGKIQATFDPAEARVVRALVGEVVELVGRRAEEAGTGADGADPMPQEASAEPRDPLADIVGMDLTWEDAAADLLRSRTPEDPALARLFPDAYAEDNKDPEAAGEFRRLTEAGLQEGKLAAAKTLLDTLPEDGGTIRLEEETAHVWLSAMNDVRLALGTRLGVDDDTDFDVDPSDPANRLITVYSWLGMLQQQLVDAVTGYKSPF